MRRAALEFELTEEVREHNQNFTKVARDGKRKARTTYMVKYLLLTRPRQSGVS